MSQQLPPGGDAAWRTFLDLGDPGGGPLHHRLARALRAALADGRIPPGGALPPSRELASDLGCSRWVVTEAYGQLVAEGHLEARSGSGTRARPQPRRAPRARPGDRPGDRPPEAVSEQAPEYDLAAGLPDLRAFPRARWADALRAATAEVVSADLGYPDPAGHSALRRRLAAYLVRSRGADLAWGELVVGAGTFDALTRACRALGAAGHTHVAVEDPGWGAVVEAVHAAGLVAVPVAVDADGLRVDRLREHPEARAVVVAPAHQFPTGVVLAPRRRTELLTWAAEVDGVVLEDDYDSEFRYDRQPVGVLQGMAPDRVVLLGSVSKTLAPALRLGWAAVPPWLAAALAADRGHGGCPPVVDQLALAHLVASGAYDRHLRASRLRYRSRRDSLLAALGERLPACRVSGVAAGFHLLLDLGDRRAGRVAAEGARRGLRVAALDRYRVVPGPRPGTTLVLGYGNLPDPAVADAVRRLAEAVDHTPRET
ncbi:PLP-dependent aminotransferase family protein [Streptomyces durbertensis]|uniref:PLP-dependent aminotransferase family protein n=1 Tax=Streptomyces durbertensis TaxID=2448886 RepID=A0ABR6EE86_9ACTN|nr:PLP-dependent aminotransferase family protein [Streptomyces durbertensis]MBB1243650.1 PLP-dependent aminotransferase family protein [Streptomyces durbertensis]